MDNNSEILAEGKNVKWINLNFEEIREIRDSENSYSSTLPNGLKGHLLS